MDKSITADKNSHKNEISCPEVQEARQFSECLVDVRVIPSAVGYTRSELRVTQRTHHGQKSTEHPDYQGQADASHFLDHSFG